MNAKIAKASRMARRKPKKAEGGPLTEPVESAPAAPAESPGFWQQMSDKIHQAREYIAPDRTLGDNINTAMMLGPIGARRLTSGSPHPVVGLLKSRQPPVEPAPVEQGRPPPTNEPMGDIQAQGVLAYRKAMGAPSDAGVWGRSGWHVGADNMARKEVIDTGSRLRQLGPIESTGVKDFRKGLGDPVAPGAELFNLEHPAGDIHGAYNIPAIEAGPDIRGMGRGSAMTNPDNNRISISSNIHSQKGRAEALRSSLHEVTHPIQRAEGFAVGSAPSSEPFFPEYWQNKQLPSMERRQQAAGLESLGEMVGATETPGFKNYHRQSGEVEPRNVEGRRAKSYNYLKHPSATEDVPRDNQIVRMESDVNAMRAKSGFADGGMPATPWFVRNEARNMNTTGGLHSPVAGRTDHLPISVPSGSYVLPADVVSGLGQGNTTSGMKVLGSMFSGGPFGTKAPKMGGGKSIPSPPKPMKFADGGGIAGLADGDDDAMGGGLDPSMDQMAPDDPSTDQCQGEDGVDIMAAGGEYVICPEIVEKLGNGDLDLGHEILDAFVKDIRKDTVKELKTLPGPVKD